MNGLRPPLGGAGALTRFRRLSARGSVGVDPIGPATVRDARKDCAGAGPCVLEAPIHPAASAPATINPTERGVKTNAISDSNLQNTQYRTPDARARSQAHPNTVWYDSTCTPIRSGVYHLR